MARSQPSATGTTTRSGRELLPLPSTPLEGTPTPRAVALVPQEAQASRSRAQDEPLWEAPWGHMARIEPRARPSACHAPRAPFQRKEALAEHIGRHASHSPGSQGPREAAWRGAPPASQGSSARARSELYREVAGAQLAESEPHGHVRRPRPARRAGGRLPGGVSCVRCGIHAAGGVSPGVDIPPLPCRAAVGEVAVCGRL